MGGSGQQPVRPSECPGAQPRRRPEGTLGSQRPSASSEDTPWRLPSVQRGLALGYSARGTPPFRLTIPGWEWHPHSSVCSRGLFPGFTVWHQMVHVLSLWSELACLWVPTRRTRRPSPSQKLTDILSGATAPGATFSAVIKVNGFSTFTSDLLLLAKPLKENFLL